MLGVPAEARRVTSGATVDAVTTRVFRVGGALAMMVASRRLSRRAVADLATELRRAATELDAVAKED